MIRHTRFRFCPRCGGTHIEDHQGKAVRCGDCAFLYFHNTASAAAVLLETEGGLLLARRYADPGKGLLDLPGGFVDYGESCESALKREIQEEMDLDPGVLTYFGSFPNTYVYRDVTYFTTDMVFRAKVPEGFKPKLNAEIQEMVLVRRESLDFQQLAFEVTKLVLRAYWKMPNG
jgi:ADP-ribose pyrophosphatase YjhB (NUDIX family)